MDTRRNVVPSIFHRALALWLISISLSFFGERQCLSQVLGGLPGNAFRPAQNETPALSPSEVVKRYWKASAEGKFSETRQYIDPLLFDPKYSGVEEIQNDIEVLTQGIPHLIYNDPSFARYLNSKPGELTIGAIDDESVTGNTATVITIDHFRGKPTSRSRFKLAWRKGEWKILDVELNYNYRGVDDLRGKNDMKKTSSIVRMTRSA
jgi:hypothetical protein